MPEIIRPSAKNLAYGIVGTRVVFCEFVEITPPPPNPTHSELLPIEGETMFERWMREEGLEPSKNWKDWDYYYK